MVVYKIIDANTIKEAIKRNNYSIRSLCSALKMNEAGFYQALNRGKIKEKTLISIANFLNVSIKDLTNKKLNVYVSRNKSAKENIVSEAETEYKSGKTDTDSFIWLLKENSKQISNLIEVIKLQELRQKKDD